MSEVYERIRDRGGQREAEVREAHPEFDHLSTRLIPWPYRNPEWPLATNCPACGRKVTEYVWGDGPGGTAGYLVIACAGSLQWLLRLFPTKLFWVNHWSMTVGRAIRHKYLNRTAA